MSLFNALSDLGNLINDTVGNNMNNDEDDVIKTKENFARIGRYEEPVENGIIDRPLDNAIRGFQRDNDLKQDGFMNPRGETEQALHREIAQTEIDTDEPSLQQAQDSRINTINKRAVFEKIVEEEHKRQNPPPAKTQEPKQEETPLQIITPPPLPERKRGESITQPKQKEAATHSPPPQPRKTLSEKDKKQLEKANENIQRKLKIFQRGNYTLAEKFLVHYLNGTGKPLELTRAEMNNSVLFNKAIKENNRRFKESIVKGVTDGRKSPFREQILNLKDGETAMLNKPNKLGVSDFWDQTIKRKDSLKIEPDYGLSIGAVQLRSLGNLKAIRQGNVIKITGEIDHTINDVYDFNDDTPLDMIVFKNERLLNRKGTAKTFKIKGTKKQKIMGTIEIQNGKIKNNNFEFQNLE